MGTLCFPHEPRKVTLSTNGQTGLRVEPLRYGTGFDVSPGVHPAGTAQDRAIGRPRSSRSLAVAVFAADVTAILLAFLVASWVVAVAGTAATTPLVDRPGSLLLVLAVLPVFAACGLYTRVGQGRSRTGADAPRVLAGVSIVGFLVVELAGVTGWDDLVSPGEMLVFWVLAMPAVLGMRCLVRDSMRARAVGAQRTIIVGSGEVGQNMARKLRNDPATDLVGFVDSDPVGLADDMAGTPILGGEDDLVEIIRATGAERIVIGFSRTAPEELIALVRTYGLHGLDISIVPRYFDLIPAHATLDDINGIPVLELRAGTLSRTAVVTKRVVDLTLTALMLPVLLPVFGLIALAIRLDSRGPVLFRQPRTGRNDRVFDIVKFRTMEVDAEARRDDLADRNESSGPLFKIREDPRITRVGRFLRRTSLDELPQLINVVRGEMSLVGPRPFVTYEDAEIQGWARHRLDVTPGLTGLWQVLGRSDITFEEMLRLDHLYATRWSLGWDMRILLKTVPAVLLRKGAY